MNNELNNRLLNIKDVSKLVRFQADWIYKQISKGKFPKPIKLGRSSRWIFKDIQQWLNNLINDIQPQDK